jgi:hypothetical protein
MEMRKCPGGSTKREESILRKLAIPNAAKNFFWKACQNLLPTKETLLQLGERTLLSNLREGARDCSSCAVGLLGCKRLMEL